MSTRELEALMVKAGLLAHAAHYGQTDNGGAERFDHVLHVGSKFEYPSNERIVGYLHDVVEDSPITYGEAKANVSFEGIKFSTEEVCKHLEEEALRAMKNTDKHPEKVLRKLKKASIEIEQKGKV